MANGSSRALRTKPLLKAWISKTDPAFRRRTGQALKYREAGGRGYGHARPQAELRRLTHSQYNHTVRDLLGDQTAPANQFPPEDFINGFRNQIAGAEPFAAADRGLQRGGREAGSATLSAAATRTG